MKINTTKGQNIVWCVDSPGWGGSEIDLIRVLKMTGMERACVLHGEQVSPELLRALRENGAEHHAVFHGGNRWPGLGGGLRRAFHCMGKFPDALFVIWSHHLDSNRWLQLGLALAGARFIVAERLVPSDASGFSRSRLTAPIKRFVSKRARCIVVNGHFQVGHYARLFSIGASRLRTIPNSRPVVQMAARVRDLRQLGKELRQKLNLPVGPVVVCLGRLCAQKDQASVIEAMGLLGSRSASRPTLVLVGEGEAENELRELASKLAPDQVIFAGFQADPVPWLAAADVFVLPSLAEGLPGALIEAMAASLPCVATDIPGNRELIRNEKTGLSVPTQEPGKLAQALERLLLDPALGRRLGEAGHEWVRLGYDESIEKAGWEEMFSIFGSAQGT